MSNKKKQVTCWMLMIIFVLIDFESLASVFYFQRGNFDHSFAIVQLVYGLKNRMIQAGVIQPNRAGYYVSDDRYGWLAKKNAKFLPHYCGSTVKYTIGPDGERKIPKPKNPIGQILFIGGSFTFGHCVNNNESYPHILATEYWRKWEVKNMAVSGFGTHQAYMRLSDSIKSDSPPSVVIYGMIPHHIQRNYLGQNWLENIAPRKLPHFELVNGEIIFKGTVGLSSAIADGSELRGKELEMTSAYLKAMQKLCADNKIPFIVLFLPRKNLPKYPPSVIYTLYKSKIIFLDLGNLEIEKLSTKDSHPNSASYRIIATAIANSFVSNTLLNLEGSREIGDK